MSAVRFVIELFDTLAVILIEDILDVKYAIASLALPLRIETVSAIVNDSEIEIYRTIVREAKSDIPILCEIFLTKSTERLSDSETVIDSVMLLIPAFVRLSESEIDNESVSDLIPVFDLLRL